MFKNLNGESILRVKTWDRVPLAQVSQLIPNYFILFESKFYFILFESKLSKLSSKFLFGVKNKGGFVFQEVHLLYLCQRIYGNVYICSYNLDHWSIFRLSTDAKEPTSVFSSMKITAQNSKCNHVVSREPPPVGKIPPFWSLYFGLYQFIELGFR